MKQKLTFQKKLRNLLIWIQRKFGPFGLRSPRLRVPTCPSFLLVHRRKLIVGTKKMPDNFIRVFKFEHRDRRKTGTIWSEMSEFSTWPTEHCFLWSFHNKPKGYQSIYLSIPFPPIDFPSYNFVLPKRFFISCNLDPILFLICPRTSSFCTGTSP